MKKRLATLSIFGAFLLSSFGVFSLKENATKVEAAIDINDYSACETAYQNNNASGMLSALRTITSPGSAGSYDKLWDTYQTAYVRDDGYLFDYYSKITNYVPGGSAQGKNYSKEGDSYNREHSIPKDWWGGAKSNQGADPFIVVPTDGYVNNRRGSYSFGMVDRENVTYAASGNFALVGSAIASWGYTGTVFEPDDSLKGDFARIMYYAIAKYSGSASWTKGNGNSNFSGSASTNYGLTNYAVKLFSYWSHLDPVSDWERSVNNKLAPIQKNRNPFIDHPEYADTLWGSHEDYTMYSDYRPEPPTLESIEVVNPKTSYYVGDQFVKPTVKANYSSGDPVDVTNKATFTGFDSSTVGNKTINVSYSGKQTSYEITVSERPVQLELTISSDSISINVQETTQISFSTNKLATVTWSINDTSIAMLTAGDGNTIIVEGMNEGTATITVTATSGDERDEKTISLTVNKLPEPPAPNKGCGGNIATTSIVLSSLALAGIVAVVIVSITRKKKLTNK